MLPELSIFIANGSNVPEKELVEPQIINPPSNVVSIQTARSLPGPPIILLQTTLLESSSLVIKISLSPNCEAIVYPQTTTPPSIVWRAPVTRSDTFEPNDFAKIAVWSIGVGVGSFIFSIGSSCLQPITNNNVINNTADIVFFIFNCLYLETLFRVDFSRVCPKDSFGGDSGCNR